MGKSVSGLCDMSGNLAEWTATNYLFKFHADKVDPNRVLRGGAWSVSKGELLRAAATLGRDATVSPDFGGVRCVRDPGKKQ
jgi:formylglycine-generating enzyme required for sulfatase activity